MRDSVDGMTQQPSRRAVQDMRISGAAPRAPLGTGRHAVLPPAGPRQATPSAEPGGPDVWIGRVRQALAARSSLAVEFAEEALLVWPVDPELLLLAALTALAVRKPERALALLKRYGKRYVPGKPGTLLTALALAQQEHFAQAWTLLQEAQLETDHAALPWFVGDDVMQDWLFGSLHDIRRARLRAQMPQRTARSPAVARTRGHSVGCQIDNAVGERLRNLLARGGAEGRRV